MARDREGGCFFGQLGSLLDMKVLPNIKTPGRLREGQVDEATNDPSEEDSLQAGVGQASQASLNEADNEITKRIADRFFDYLEKNLGIKRKDWKVVNVKYTGKWRSIDVKHKSGLGYCSLAEIEKINTKTGECKDGVLRISAGPGRVTI